MLHAAGVVTDEFTNEKLIVATGGRSLLSNQSERCWSQYTFINPLETEANWFTDTRFVKKYMFHGGILKKYWF